MCVLARLQRAEDSTKEFGVVFVRQWVDWKDSELEQWWQLGRLNFTAVS